MVFQLVEGAPQAVRSHNMTTPAPNVHCGIPCLCNKIAPASDHVMAKQVVQNVLQAWTGIGPPLVVACRECDALLITKVLMCRFLKAPKGGPQDNETHGATQAKSYWIPSMAP